MGQNEKNPIYNANRMKLGVFASNGKGTTMTLVPEAHRADWKKSLEACVVADRAGFEALVPYARWKGYVDGKPDHPSATVLEPYAWAAGIAQATEHACVFSTSHIPTIHPIFAAKQGATIDHISGGRFALNVVGGWNKPELEMFGAPMKEHELRYDQVEEWLTIVQRLWTERDEFDHEGQFYKINGGLSSPKPIQQHVPIMNAGGSDKGRHFAAKNADLCFLIIRSENEDEIRAQVDDYRNLAHTEYGRDVQIWMHSYVVQRETAQEADAYLNRYVVEMGDHECVDAWVEKQAANTKLMSHEALEQMRFRFAAGAGGFPLVGTAEMIVDRLSMLSRAGIAGILLSWVDYAEGLERWNRSVMPMLEQAGLREPFRGAASGA
ncbi:LLM class flavin-dependent oxidoreductase [Chelatococcus asaccharovorans]|uniref:LLM class flavin-dependent oxidoreductase n=1 Tax=Chelatococcus asaccharovorans TaxID=28210 RepID=UPI00224C6997|nr:LLM class flavin-dependent oxidoreductase [Chelatococcus asaccharovorans]CAH1653203.1 Alkanesulfonate monooxygenase SsuD/methylene tetrahydromethanopterin reductase-like flavin-dependent oxidoreductase (Luciferase family) [Chelatococcus asaccharovorans]CAH1686113.1 Alkanesulfonate monooxygenase SsuD/methylene tetrahydromethanopterin reductase-like flavin-dependent oxidoreductase (Luciferase family) [Chelatococcus asaccharovorans]